MKWKGRTARWVVGVVAFALAAAAALAPEVGEPPPDYLGKTPDGEEVRIRELAPDI